MRTLFHAVVIVWLAATAAAQFGGDDAMVVAFDPAASRLERAPDGTFTATVAFTVAPGWHINADAVDDEFLFPSKLEIAPAEGLEVASIAYPPPKRVTLAISDKPLRAWEGRVAVVVKGRAAGAAALTGTFTSQACNNAVCQPPSELKFTLDGGGDGVAAAGGPQPLPGGTAETLEPENLIARWIRQKGMGLALLLIFLSGLALNLTPCVYPMIPITLGFFAKQGQAGKHKPFALSLAYFLGLTLTYSAVGTAAAFTGALFGTLMQKPAVLITVAGIIVVLALSLFGLFTLQLPAGLTSRVSGRAGLAGAALMGAMVGLVAAPCIGPVVLALLTFVAAAASPLIGFATFFTLSAGLGLPYLFLGFFSAKLPRSGGWMIALEYFFGFLLLGVALFILKPLLPGHAAALLGALLALAAAAVFLLKRPGGHRTLTAVFGLLALALGIALLVPLFQTAPEGAAGRFPPYTPSAADAAFRAGKVVMLDFAADWCLPCKEMEKLTFSDEKVQGLLARLAPFRADVTTGGDAAVKKLSEAFAIRGVPTVVFMKEGREIEPLRLVGFEGPEAFAARLEKVLQ
jgi:thiol:disulfide interchange protein DsbD